VVPVAQRLGQPHGGTGVPDPPDGRGGGDTEVRVGLTHRPQQGLDRLGGTERPQRLGRRDREPGLVTVLERHGQQGYGGHVA
jgi:hypothetical protein